MKRIIFLIVCAFASCSLMAQSGANKDVIDLLNERGEAKICIDISKVKDIVQLGRTISIDPQKGSTWIGYVNKKQYTKFLALGIEHTLYKETKTKSLLMANSLAQMSSWNRYPTYEVYDSMMRAFATNYPTICKLDTIGFSTNNRLLLCLKISSSPNTDQDKPKFFYTSSIHGDEITGIVMMLRFATQLLSGYNTDSRATNLINSTQIFINPEANPDGTYHGGNSTVSDATRYNANYVDLNRNYPDPVAGAHSDGEAYQSETLAFMAYADSNGFDISANLHGGSEVFNYPYDCYTSSQKEHADKAWFEQIGAAFFDSINSSAPSSFFTDVVSNGVVDGGDWYTVAGGRQDWSTYFKHSREVTIEISQDKELSSTQLNNYWTYLQKPFVTYAENALVGLQGYVKDSLSLAPIKAKVWIESHDAYNSEIYSKATTGYYYRPIVGGTYNITYSADGYTSKTIYNVNVTNNTMSEQNVFLAPVQQGLPGIDNNSFKPLNYVVYNAIGTKMQEGKTLTQDFKSLIAPLASGLYFIRIGDKTYKYVKQ